LNRRCSRLRRNLGTRNRLNSVVKVREIGCDYLCCAGNRLRIPANQPNRLVTSSELFDELAADRAARSEDAGHGCMLRGMTDSLQERVIGKKEVIDRVPDFEAQQLKLRDPEAASGKLVGAVRRFPASPMVWSQAGADWFPRPRRV